MDPITVAALISAGSSIFGGLLGRNAQSAAQKAQDRSNKQASDVAFKDRAAELAQAQAEAERQYQRDLMRNAWMRSRGWTGITDPATPANLIGIAKGAGDIPPQTAPRPRVTIGALAGMPVVPVEAPPIQARQRGLGSMFGR